MSWPYRDTWNGRGYTRQIQGCTLRILLQHTDNQHYSAARDLHSYCSLFGIDGPIVIGRGSHNIWRPEGYASLGTRTLSMLEVYCESMTRENFAAIVGKTPDQRQYLPGEVVLYGNGVEMAVCLDGYGGEESAIPLAVYSSADAAMAGFPGHVPRESMMSSSYGFNLICPLWALVLALGQWAQLQTEISKCTNDPASYEWVSYYEHRQATVADDIHDLRYLCYSNFLKDGTCVQANDQYLEETRRHVDSYLRGWVGTDAVSEAQRETATDHFVHIGLLTRGGVMGPRYDIYGTQGWNPNRT